MSLNTALAISLGVLGAVATWLFLGPLGGMLAIWAAFIAWGCFFHNGGKEAGLQSTILGTAAGAVIAGITASPGSVTSASLGNPVVTIILSMIVGAIFGYVSEKVAGMMVGSDHHAAAKA
jgi:hypothetical protein